MHGNLHSEPLYDEAKECAQRCPYHAHLRTKGSLWLSHEEKIDKRAYISFSVSLTQLLNDVFCTWGVLECILGHRRSLINEVAYLRLGAMCLGDGRFFGRQGWMCWTRFVVPNVWLSQGFGKNRPEPRSILGAIYFTSTMIELIEYQNSIHSTCYVILSIV